MLMLGSRLGRCRGETARVHTTDPGDAIDGHSELLVHAKGGKVRTVPLLDEVAATIRASPPGWLSRTARAPTCSVRMSESSCGAGLRPAPLRTSCATASRPAPTRQPTTSVPCESFSATPAWAPPRATLPTPTTHSETAQVGSVAAGPAGAALAELGLSIRWHGRTTTDDTAALAVITGAAVALIIGTEHAAVVV